METLTFVAKRILSAVLSLLVLSLVLFFLVRLLPGDPALALLGMRATPETLEAVRGQLDLDLPLHVQLLNYYARLLQGDLGASIATAGTSGALSGRPVIEIIAGGLEVTAWLALLGILLAAIAGLALGILAGTRKSWQADGIVSSAALVGVSIPDFFLATLLVLLFTVTLRWLPSVGFVSPFDDFAGGMRSLALPVLTIAIINMSAIARITRSSLRELRGAEFAVFARSKGMRESIVTGKHTVRAALIPVVTVIGLQLGFLFGGVVVVESVFGLPGMGRLLIIAVDQRDYPTIMGLILAFAALFLLVNLIVDILYRVLDPRTQRGLAGA